MRKKKTQREKPIRKTELQRRKKNNYMLINEKEK